MFEFGTLYHVLVIGLSLFTTVSIAVHPNPSMSSSSSNNTTPTSSIKKYTIATTWDGDKPTDNAEIHLTFEKTPSGLLIEIDAPFYDDPSTKDIPVGSTDKLWNYEVVEVFFLSETEKMYLETEFAPRGHYLLLQLDTSQKVLKYQLPLDDYTAKIDSTSGRWQGRALIPLEYLPQNVNKFNAYAIHKSDPHRVYMSLYPAAKGKYAGPNFHRLNYFKDIDLN